MENTSIKHSESWIWLDAPEVSFAEAHCARPLLPIGEAQFGGALDRLEKWLGTTDIVFQIRDQLLKNIFAELKRTPRKPNNFARCEVIISNRIKNDGISLQSVPWERSLYRKNRSPEKLLEHWLQQQFAIWRSSISGLQPVLSVHIKFVSGNLKKRFQILPVEIKLAEPKGYFEFISPYVPDETIHLFECPLSLGSDYILELGYEWVHNMPFLGKDHVQIYWDGEKPWLRHMGFCETWFIANENWYLIPDNTIVPMLNGYHIILGRMSSQINVKSDNRRLQPVQGSLVLRYRER